MITKYFKFLITATNQHGVHSPFVYQLVTECFYKKSPLLVVKAIKSYKKKLKQKQQIIAVTDFGAGSKVFNSNHRKIRAIAKNVALPLKYATLLNRIVTHFSCKNVLELGTSLGAGTFSLVVNHPNTNITTIEGCPETLKVAKKQLKKYQNQITFVQGKFKEELPKLVTNTTYDLIYFDGDHQKESTLAYFEQCLQAKHNDSVFILDDIYWSKGMEQAWKSIQKHPEVTVTIDLFHWGLVFFRKEQQKEHFKIRV